jgi:hypothetical protein
MGAPYAARTLTRNSSTALRSMPDWVSSSRAFASTSDAALPVAVAAVVTPPIWVAISFDPAATDWMLRAISRVAPPCCSTALEIETVISLICEMVSVMPPIEATASLVEACDLGRDFLGRLCGLVGERLHFRRHDREPAAGIAGARRFDGGVERQQVGLRRDRVDQFHHFADLLGADRERADGGVGALGIAHRLARDFAGTRHLTGDFRDRTGKLFRGRRHGADIVR